MTISTALRQSILKAAGKSVSTPSNSFLNAYSIINADQLSWEVNLYRVQYLNEFSQDHEDRGSIKDVMWQLRKKYASQCRGYGFILDVDKDLVVVPKAWKFPAQETISSYKVTFEKTFVANAAAKNDRLSQKAAHSIIREGIKKHFKENRDSTELGKLWQDGNYFCQKPTRQEKTDYYYLSRRFTPSVKTLQGGKSVVQIVIGTTMIDGRSLSDYYDEGEVDSLAALIATKQGDKLNRQNQEVKVKVLRTFSVDGTKNKIILPLDLEDIDLIFKHARLSPREQQKLSGSSVFCRQFAKEPEAVSLAELFLVVDAQITQEDHGETIIDPTERYEITSQVRNFINRCDIYNQELELANLPVDAEDFKEIRILPPDIKVKGINGTEILKAPKNFNAGQLRDRINARVKHIRKNGFLEDRSINPLLAYPNYLGKAGAEVMVNELNAILETQNINYRFKYFLYNNAEEVRKKIENGDNDAVLFVLPNEKDSKYGETYKFVKQNIQVPTQCIQVFNAVSKKFLGVPFDELRKQNLKLANRLRQRYEICIWNLLVKHHWIPFIPANSFNYNVQLGLDVGGTHNTHALSCLGYGFQKPTDELIFRPEEIPVDVGKAEPIPTDSLYSGLLRQFQTVRTDLLDSGSEVDFNSMLFFRDGQLLGDGEKWNEKDALNKLHEEFLRRGWINKNAVWTAVEVMKYAEGWRIMNSTPEIENPVAGICIQPFDDENTFLVCTTGAQHLTQGTAGPVLVRITNICGKANYEDVLRDLIWQADMCFTKLDAGMKLPWVLQVAGAGALQISRSYKITGVTV